MSRSESSSNIRGIEQLRRQVERWRSKRRPGQAMPERLWAAAAKLAQRHGVWPTARALGLAYPKLKQWVQGGRQPPEVPSSPAFVELIAPVGGSCCIELEGAGGMRLRIEVPVASSAALVQELCRVVQGAA